MVEDIELTIGLLESILTEARRPPVTFGEKAGLYAALGYLKESLPREPV